MATPQPGRPQQGTGLPPGVEVGPLGSRLIAYLVDSLVPGVLGALLGLALPGLSGSARSVLSVIFVVLIIGWLLLVWRMIAVRAASPGMRLMKLQVVGFYDGRPIGWARAFLRGLVIGLLFVTGLGLILLLVFLLLHPRRQGWHDLVAKAVVIKERGLPPAPAVASDGADAALEEGSAEPAPTGADDDGQAPGGYPSPAYEVGEARPPVAASGSGPAAPLAAPAGGASAFDPSGLPPLTSPAPSGPMAGPSNGGSRSPGGPFRKPPAAPPVAVPDVQSGWVAELDDGRELLVEGLVLLGRNPQPQPGEEDAQLIKLADETRTVSKSHLAIGLDTAGLFVVDRGSTNGSTVTTPAGVSKRVRAGEIAYVDEGSVVSIGDHWLRIHRSTS